MLYRITFYYKNEPAYKGIFDIFITKDEDINVVMKDLIASHSPLIPGNWDSWFAVHND